MPRATWVQSNFNGGEWSPLAYGRFDLAKFKNGLADCTNYLPMQQGGLARRPGTRFVAATKDTSYPVRLEKFEFSIAQAYVLEFGNLYIRFYTNDGQLQTSGVAAYNGATAYNPGDLVTNGGVTYYCIAATTGNAPPNATYWYAQAGTIYEIPTPYASTDIWNLGFTQKADVIYITLPTQPVYKLQRKGATNWVMNLVSFLDGPYQPLNITGTTLQVSGTQGTVTVTASGTAGINGGAGFRSGDVGRALRVRLSQTVIGLPGSSPGGPPDLLSGIWLWGIIASVSSTTSATLGVVASNDNPLPSPAAASTTLAGGVVIGVTVTAPGGGYKGQNPGVRIVPGDVSGITPAVVTVTTVPSSGAISSLNLISGGSGYAPSTNFPLQISGGSGSGGYATSSAGGVITSVTQQGGGHGYTNSSAVTVLGAGTGAGSGATATATVDTDGHVVSVTVTNGGSGYTSGATAFIDPPLYLNTLPTTFWQLGLMNSVDGYAGISTFHQDRLILSGYASYPNRVDGSNVADYENFAPTEVDGTVTDADAFSFNLTSGPINIVQWIASDENGVLAGTAGNEWLVTPSTTQQALTPTNVNARVMSGYGSAAIPAIRMGKATLFVQRTQRKLRELFFQFYGNTFLAQDISLVGEHLTTSGIKQMAAQLAPQQVIWFVLNNGRLTAATYDKDQDVNGWHKHYLGGFSDVAQTLPPTVDSVCVIPAPSTQRDEVWLAVNRYINGATFRSIEVMTKMWEDGDTLANAAFLDSSAEYSGAPTTTVTGLTWLKGQKVGVLADGATHPDVTVDNTGAITLVRSASTVQVGLKYISSGKTLRIEAGGADGPSQGKLKRIHRAIMQFFQTMGFNMQSDDPTVTGGFYPVDFRSSADLMDQGVPLFSGDMKLDTDTTWTRDGQLAWQQTDPLPGNITQLVVQLETQDGG